MVHVARGTEFCGLFSANIVFISLVLADAFGIAPNSSALRADADLSQLNVQKFGEAERTRTVIVFLDREVHTPFCHGPSKLRGKFWVDRRDLNPHLPRSQRGALLFKLRTT